MNFIRPELKRRIWRWREVLIGLFVAACGMIWAVGQTGILAAIGLALTVVGALVTFAGFQRTRFRVGAGGPGVVQVTERQVTYYGPFDGGAVSIDALVRVDLDPGARPFPAWILCEAGGNVLAIPTHAENADALFDVFAALDGIRTENMLTKLRGNPRERVRIWECGPRRLH